MLKIRTPWSTPIAALLAIAATSSPAIADSVCIGVEALAPQPLGGVELRFEYTSRTLGDVQPVTDCRIASKQANLIAIDGRNTAGTSGTEVSKTLVVSGRIVVEEMSALVTCDLDDPDQASLAVTLVTASTPEGEEVDNSTLATSIIAGRCPSRRQ